MRMTFSVLTLSESTTVLSRDRKKWPPIHFDSSDVVETSLNTHIHVPFDI